MKKSILNLGKILKTTEQKQINGGISGPGDIDRCVTSGNCMPELYGHSIAACINGICIYPYNE